MTTRESLSHRTPPLDALEVAVVTLVAAVAAVSAMILALAWAGHLRTRPLVFCVVAGIAAVATWIVRSRSTRALTVRLPSARSAVAAVLIVVAGGVLFFRPARYVFDGVDGSVYVAVARLLQAHGTMTPEDGLAASLDEADRAALFPPLPAQSLPTRFPGGIQMTAAGDRWQPDFFPLVPAYMASASLVFGSWSLWYVNPLLALGSVFLLWLFGRRMSGARTGAIAALLLLANLAEVWFARLPTSEIAAQCLVLAGLYLTLVAIDTRWTVAAAAAGAAFGLLAFARIDMLTLASPAIAVLLVVLGQTKRGAPTVPWIASPFALLTLAAVVYAMTAAQHYTRRIFGMLFLYVTSHPSTLIVAAAGLVVAVGLLAMVRSGRRLPRGAAVIAGAALVGLVAFLLWRDLTHGYFWQLVTPVGVGLGLCGLAALAWRADAVRAVPVVLLFLTGMAYLREPLGEHVVPGGFRRYVPVLLPIVLFGIAHAAAVARARWRRGAVALAVPVLLAGWFAWHTWPIAARSVMAFGEAELAKVGAVTEPDSLLVWDAATPNHLALAAQTSLGRESLVVPATDAAVTPLRRIVTAALAAGRPVRLLADQRQGTTQGSWRARLGGLELLPLTTVPLRAESLVPAKGPFPYRVHESERWIDVYALAPEAVGADVPLRIDIGERDLPYLIDGFFPTERHDIGTVRWIGPVARLHLPRLRLPPASTLRLTIRLATFRPPDMPVEVLIDWDGRPVGRLTPASSFADYELSLAGVIPDRPSELTFRSDTFVPRDHGIGSDARRLGVLIDWIVIDAAAPSGSRPQ